MEETIEKNWKNEKSSGNRGLSNPRNNREKLKDGPEEDHGLDEKTTETIEKNWKPRLFRSQTDQQILL